MTTRRPHRTPAGAAEVAVLARGCASAGALSGVTALVPFSATAPTTMAALLAVVGLVLGGALWRTRSRTPRVAAHAVVVLATLCVTACVAASTTPAGTAVTAVGFLWVTAFTAVFHTARAMVAHVALILAGLAVGLAVAGAVSPVQTWVFIGTTACLVAGVTHGDVSRLRRRADRDALTGALTRAAFRDAAEAAMATARRRGERLALAILDLDDFKQVNDEHGHAAGDRVLAELVRAWRGVLGPGELLGRHGGDEFVVLLRPEADGRPGGTLARLDASTDASRWTTGAATWSGEDFEGWLLRADADLYRRKGLRGEHRRGRGPACHVGGAAYAEERPAPDGR